MLHDEEKANAESLIPQRLKLKYTDFKLISAKKQEKECGTPGYILFEAKSQENGETHFIKTLDVQSPFIDKNYDISATLFVQELLHLITTFPNKILIDTFQISDKNITYASQPFCSLKREVASIAKGSGQTELNIEKLLQDVLSELNSINKEVKLSNCGKLLSTDNVFRFKDNSDYFLGDWIKSVVESQNASDSLIKKSDSKSAQSLVMTEEISAFGFDMLRLFGVEDDQISLLQKIKLGDPTVYRIKAQKLISDKFKGSNASKKLLFSMIDDDSNNRPKLDDFAAAKSQIKKEKAQQENVGQEEEKKIELIPVSEEILKKIESAKSQKDLVAPDTPKFAWCSRYLNKITIWDLKKSDVDKSFFGILLDKGGYNTCVLQLPGSDYLVSNAVKANNAGIYTVFDVSKPTPISVHWPSRFSGNTSLGEIAHSTKRNLIAMFPDNGNATYYLFSYQVKNEKELVSLVRKARWEPGHRGHVRSIDFDSEGKIIAANDQFGVLVLKDVDKDSSIYTLPIEKKEFSDGESTCRWTNVGSTPSVIFTSVDNRLNILDTQKLSLILKAPFIIDQQKTHTTDVCRTNNNLLAISGTSKQIKIYDQREGKVAKIYSELVHTGDVNCVRWSPDGILLATAGQDQNVNLIDSRNGKVILTGTSGDKRAQIGGLDYESTIYDA